MIVSDLAPAKLDYTTLPDKTIISESVSAHNNLTFNIYEHIITKFGLQPLSQDASRFPHDIGKILWVSMYEDTKAHISWNLVKRVYHAQVLRRVLEMRKICSLHRKDAILEMLVAEYGANQKISSEFLDLVDPIESQVLAVMALHHELSTSLATSTLGSPDLLPHVYALLIADAVSSNLIGSFFRKEEPTLFSLDPILCSLKVPITGTRIMILEGVPSCNEEVVFTQKEEFELSRRLNRDFIFVLFPSPRWSPMRKEHGT
ncbi:MAG: hypothetical protein ACPLW8_03840 [Candidatus Bathyarchaeales archaeon]